jgi:hypothetical protein
VGRRSPPHRERGARRPHLAARPGSDSASPAWCATCSRPTPTAPHRERADGVDELAGAVEPFDRDHVAALTGIAAVDLDALVAAVRAAGRLAVVTGTGTTMARSGLPHQSGWRGPC